MQREKKGCPGRGKIFKDRFRQTKKHDHPSNNYAEKIRIFKHALKKRVENDFRSNKDI